jgi:hypothetical protein
MEWLSFVQIKKGTHNGVPDLQGKVCSTQSLDATLNNVPVLQGKPCSTPISQPG